MNELLVVDGFHGEGNKYSCEILTYTTHQGTWYTQVGGTMVFLTQDEVCDGVNVEELSDDDYFSYSPIDTLEELKIAVES